MTTFTLDEAIEEIGRVISDNGGDGDRAFDVLKDHLVGPRSIMGAKDVAEALGVKVPNLKYVKIEPVARISGGAIPVYLRADVEAEQERRRLRAAAAAE